MLKFINNRGISMLIMIKTWGIEVTSIGSEISLIRNSNVIITDTKQEYLQWQK